MHGKVIWKHGIGKISKASRDIAPGPHKGGGGGDSAPVSNTKFGLWILSNLPNSEKSGIFKNNIFEFIKPKPNSFF